MNNFEDFINGSRKENLYRKQKNSNGHYSRLGDEKNGNVDDLPFKGKMSNKNNYENFDYAPFFRFMISKIGTDFDDACSEAKRRMSNRFYEVLDWMFDFNYEHGRYLKNRTMFNFGSRHFPMLIVDDNNLIQLKDKNYKLNNIIQ